MNHRVSIVVNSTSASRLKAESERPQFPRKPATSQNQCFQKNVCTAPFFIVELCQEFSCSLPLVICVIYGFQSFSGQRSTVVPTQGPSTPLNREFPSISSCSFFFFILPTYPSQSSVTVVCVCELQAADEKNLTPQLHAQRHVFSRSSQYIRMANACLRRHTQIHEENRAHQVPVHPPSPGGLHFRSFSVLCLVLYVWSLRGLRRSAFLFQLFLCVR